MSPKSVRRQFCSFFLHQLPSWSVDKNQCFESLQATKIQFKYSKICYSKQESIAFIPQNHRYKKTGCPTRALCHVPSKQDPIIDIYSFSFSSRSGIGITRSSVSGSLIYSSSHARCASINVLIACSVARNSVKYISL